MYLGDNIRMYREQKQLTQTDLAKLLNVTPSLISQYESNGKIPNFMLGIRIAKILGVTAEELMSGKENAV